MFAANLSPLEPSLQDLARLSELDSQLSDETERIEQPVRFVESIATHPGVVLVANLSPLEPSMRALTRLSECAAHLSAEVTRLEWRTEFCPWDRDEDEQASLLVQLDEMRQLLAAVRSFIAVFSWRLLVASRPALAPPAVDLQPLASVSPLRGSASSLAPPARPATGPRLEGAAA